MQLVLENNVLLVDPIPAEQLQARNPTGRLGTVAEPRKVDDAIRTTVRRLPERKGLVAGSAPLAFNPIVKHVRVGNSRDVH